MNPVTETWTSVNPEERSILTANRVNVQNQKFKKELALKHRGIEDEMKCDNIIYSKKEHVMQNRLSRLNKASDNNCNRMGTPFSSASSDNWLTEKASLQQENLSVTSRGSTDSLARTYKDHSVKTGGSADRSRYVDGSTKRPESDQRKRHVRFGHSSATNTLVEGLTEASDESKASSPRRRKSLQLDEIRRDSLLGHRTSRDAFDDVGSTSTSNQLPSIDKLSISRQMRSQSLSGAAKNLPGFSSSLNVRSHSNLAARNSLKAVSGLEEEMARWRRLHHTRSVNARIKAVRTGGKRRSSCLTLRETMDHAALLRKEEALHPEPFTADKAWELLNCRYLRLTPSNVATLEDMCSNAGYDVSGHPHKSTDDAWEDMQNAFEELRESHRMQKDVPSQIKFRQSLLFKRLSDFSTS